MTNLEKVYYKKVLNEAFDEAFGAFTDESANAIYTEMEEFIRARALILGIDARREYIQIKERRYFSDDLLQK
jgi:hypothetical protein